MGEQLLLSNFINVKEVSKYLEIKESTVYFFVERKRIPIIELGDRSGLKNRTLISGWKVREQK